ncbi:MAG: DUF1622 domain-containing protein [Actinomycetota bacterium]|nr:DUF1622 domain-containing protein [Actinomycetota bacterium]
MVSHETFAHGAETLGVAIEAMGILVILASVALATVLFVVRASSQATRGAAYADTRRCLGRGILLGLELLVAGDIVRTVAVDPSLTSVGLLGLIVLIRTFLSFALEVELTGTWPWARRQSSAADG